MTSAAGDRYSRVAILLHWLIAALILANITVGLMHEDMTREARQFWMGQHFASGMTILILSVLRVGWRIGHGVPALSPDHAAWERLLVRTTHILFYVLMIGLPIFGWLALSTGRQGGAVDMWGLFEIPGLPTGMNGPAHELLETIHGLLGKGMLGLVGLHLLGALKHHLMDRDSTLARMMPWFRRDAA